MNIKTLLSHFMKSKKVEISELRAVIEQSGNSHLPLSCRVELLQSIGNVEIVNKVFAECCKKVYPLWGNEIEDTLLRKLLCSADEYLYHRKGKADALVEEANRLRNYVEGQSCTESMAGWAVISLCYSIADHAVAMLDIDEYEGEDDGAFEYEVWNTDFFASMAFAGGNPFVDEGDAGKRREFWNWYLDTVETLCRKSDAPLIRIDAPKKKEVEQNTIPQRTQTYQTPDILLKIQQIIEKTTKVFNDYCTGNWDRIIVEAYCIGDVRTEGYFICNNIVSKMPVSLSTADLLSEIKIVSSNYALQPNRYLSMEETEHFGHTTLSSGIQPNSYALHLTNRLDVNIFPASAQKFQWSHAWYLNWKPTRSSIYFMDFSLAYTKQKYSIELQAHNALNKRIYQHNILSSLTERTINQTFRPRELLIKASYIF